MSDDKSNSAPPPTTAAERALAEAAARRARAADPERPPEVNGRKGPEPTRFGDWECKGIASDF
ncbi:MAG: DUF1674 domain-containing protein [Alphaproteobacteria bacterium]|nr:DUF1674 domain-containing protein [Alphaproteobacteria bacterium]